MKKKNEIKDGGLLALTSYAPLRTAIEAWPLPLLVQPEESY